MEDWQNVVYNPTYHIAYIFLLKFQTELKFSWRKSWMLGRLAESCIQNHLSRPMNISFKIPKLVKLFQEENRECLENVQNVVFKPTYRLPCKYLLIFRNFSWRMSGIRGRMAERCIQTNLSCPIYISFKFPNWVKIFMKKIGNAWKIVRTFYSNTTPPMYIYFNIQNWLKLFMKEIGNACKIGRTLYPSPPITSHV